MKCIETTEMSLFLDGSCEEERLAAIRAHLDSCDNCATLLDEVTEITSGLAPDEGELEDPQLTDDVMTLIRLGQAPRFQTPERSTATAARVWIPAGLLAIAAAAALAIAIPSIFSDQAPKTHAPLFEFTARGGDNAKPSRWASVKIFRSSEGRYVPVEDAVARDDALAIAYENRDENAFSYLMIFAVDDEGTIFWYYPAYQEEDVNPSSISIRRTDQPVRLPDAVTHELREGPLEMVALFSHDPIDVKSVERAVDVARASADSTGIMGDLDLEGIVSQRIVLGVVDSAEDLRER